MLEKKVFQKSDDILWDNEIFLASLNFRLNIVVFHTTFMGGIGRKTYDMSLHDPLGHASPYRHWFSFHFEKWGRTDNVSNYCDHLWWASWINSRQLVYDWTHVNNDPLFQVPSYSKTSFALWQEFAMAHWVTQFSERDESIQIYYYSGCACGWYCGKKVASILAMHSNENKTERIFSPLTLCKGCKVI